MASVEQADYTNGDSHLSGINILYYQTHYNRAHYTSHKDYIIVHC